MINDKLYQYDVAISYASEDRMYAEELALALKRRSIKVFYDQNESTRLWGSNIIDSLSETYMDLARYCIIFFSKNYITKKWTRLERQIAQHRALDEIEPYILPILLDDVKLSGFLATLTSQSWQDGKAETFAEMIAEKLSLNNLSLKKIEEPEWYQNFYKGNEFLASQEFEKGLNAYQRALSVDSYPVIYNNRGVALYCLRDYDGALDAFQKALRNNDAIRGYPKQHNSVSEETFLPAFQCDINFLATYSDAVAQNNEGRVLYRLKRYNDALKVSEYVIQIYPNFAAAYDTRGRVLNRLTRYKEALEVCEKAISLDSKLAVAYDDKSWSLYGLKCYEEALEASEQAIWLDPQLATAYNNKGRALNELGKNEHKHSEEDKARGYYEEALVAYERAIKLDGNDAKVFNNKGQTLRNLRRYKEALEAYEKAIELDKNYPVAYHNKGQVLYKLGHDKPERYKEALSALDQALRLYNAALESFREDIDLFFKLAVVYKDRGENLLKLNRKDRALEAFEKALQFDPKLADAYTGKGHALGTLKRHEEARSAFEKAKKLRNLERHDDK